MTTVVDEEDKEDNKEDIFLFFFLNYHYIFYWCCDDWWIIMDNNCVFCCLLLTSFMINNDIYHIVKNNISSRKNGHSSLLMVELLGGTSYSNRYDSQWNPIVPYWTPPRHHHHHNKQKKKENKIQTSCSTILHQGRGIWATLLLLYMRHCFFSEYWFENTSALVGLCSARDLAGSVVVIVLFNSNWFVPFRLIFDYGMQDCVAFIVPHRYKFITSCLSSFLLTLYSLLSTASSVFFFFFLFLFAWIDRNIILLCNYSSNWMIFYFI